MEQNSECEKTGVIVWNTNALNKSRSADTMASATGDEDNRQEAVGLGPPSESRASSEDAERDEDDSSKANVIGSPDWQQRKMRLLKPWPVPKLHIEPYSEEGLQGISSDVVEDRNSLSPVIPHLLDKARSCSTSSCSTDSTDLGSQESPMQQETEDSRRDGKDVFYKKKLRARYLSSQSSEDSEADVQRQTTTTSASAAVQREEFKLRSKSADYYESPAKSRPVLQRQSQSLSTISEGRCNNLLQWWTNHGSLAAEKQLSDGVQVKQEPYSPRHSPMLLSRHSLESLSDAPDVFSPLTPQSFSLPLQFDGDGGVFRFPGDGTRQFTPPRSPRSPRYIPDSRLECLSEQLPLQSNSTNTLSIPSPASPNKSPSNMKEYHPQNIFTFSPLVIPPGEGSLKTLPRTPTSGFPLGLQDNPSTYPPKYLFSPQLYNDLAEAQRHRHNSNNNNNSNGTGGKMDNTFICPICGQIFSSFDNLAKHMAKHLPTETVRSGNNNKIHYCKVCNRAFARSDMLTRHMRLHTGLKPYECQVCGQVFSRSDHLNTHQRTHTGEKPYKCPQCPYAACRRDMITRHMRIHSKQWPRRGGLKNVSKDDIRKCSLSSVDSMESADTGHGNMSVSSLDSVDLEKDSRKGSYGSSDSLESDLSGRSFSGDGSVDLAGSSHNWPVDSRLQQGERSPKRTREGRVGAGDNRANMFLQIPGRSASSSMVDSDDIPSPRPNIWSPAGSLDEQLLLGLPVSPLPRRANSEESRTHEGVSPILTARGGSENVSAPVTGDEGQEAFFQHRNNRTISLESECLSDTAINRSFSVRRSGLKKQRNISCTSIDSVDSSFMDEGSVKSENSVSLDENAFLKCTVSPSAKENSEAMLVGRLNSADQRT